MKRSSKILIALSVILSLLLAGTVALLWMQHQQMQQQSKELDEITAQMEFEKQQSVEEFEQLMQQYEEYYVLPGNDSLLRLIDEEKQKVQQLLQELKTVKATNARRIAELRQELTTVRSVLKSYIVKVDSLNTVNDQLKTENRRVRQRYEKQSLELQQKVAEAEELDKKITQASLLETAQIQVKPLNKKGATTKVLRKITKLEICFQVLRNITTERGVKTIYMRISGPSEEVLPLPDHPTFPFEDGQVEYSAVKKVEYGGEDLPVCMYYTVTEPLQTGTYSIHLFIEGNLAGSTQFVLK